MYKIVLQINQEDRKINTEYVAQGAIRSREQNTVFTINLG